MEMLLSIENSGFGSWMRESSSIWAFPMFLFLHTLGMSIIAGGAAIVDFAVLGMWPRRASIKPLEKYFPLLWAGLVLNVVTGVSIFTKDASTYGRNPDFYVKLVFVIAGVVLLARLRKVVFQGQGDTTPETVPSSAKIMAWGSLACWFGAIVAGRLIAYVGPVPGLY